MNFQSKTTHQSARYPGVSFVVRTLSEGRRIKLNLALAAEYDRIDALRREAAVLRESVKPLLDEVKDKPKEEAAQILGASADFAKVMELQRKIDSIESDSITPVYVNMLLASVIGLTDDGEPVADPLSFVIEDGPRDLYLEIVEAVKRAMGLTDEESGNSGSPSISTALVAGEIPTTSAEPASGAATA